MRLVARADADLNRAFTYSLRHFGERQAIAYVEALRLRILSLLNNPNLGHPVEGRSIVYRALVHKLHIIYYRVARDEIVVLRITDARRDPQHHR